MVPFRGSFEISRRASPPFRYGSPPPPPGRSTILAKIAGRSALLILPQLICIQCSLRLGRKAGAGEEDASGVGLKLGFAQCGFEESHGADEVTGLVESRGEKLFDELRSTREFSELNKELEKFGNPHRSHSHMHDVFASAWNIIGFIFKQRTWNQTSQESH